MNIIAGLDTVLKEGQTITLIDDSGEPPIKIPGTILVSKPKYPNNRAVYKVVKSFSYTYLAKAIGYSLSELQDDIKNYLVVIK